MGNWVFIEKRVEYDFGFLFDVKVNLEIFWKFKDLKLLEKKVGKI